MPKEPEELHPTIVIRETYIAQLPIIAALLAIGEEKVDYEQLAADAVTLCRCIEEELA